jgi:pimeloyl-ACP methyl ester carboxylesterase
MVKRTTTGGTDPLRIRSGRAQLHAVRRGVAGAPAVVFLHAGIADHRSWNEVMDQLKVDRDVVAYDRRCFGFTTYRPERHDQVEDLVALLDQLKFERVVLVGNSRGGAIALDAALAHPDRVSALVLVAPAVTGAPPVDERDLAPEEAAIWASLEAAAAAGALDALNLAELRLWLDGPGAPEGRVAGARRDLALEMNRIPLHAASPGTESEAPEAWNRLSSVRCPALVVLGDLDLAHVQERGRQLASALPTARLHVMEGAAHLAAFEQPEAFAAAAGDFLAAPAT